MPDSPYIQNPGWTCTITAGSAAVPVSGVVAHLQIQAGDHLIGSAGGLMAIGAVSAGAITLLRAAPAAQAGAGIPLIVERGPWRAMPAAAALVSREVYDRMQVAASDGRSLPVISILNAPPATPAHGDCYLIGAAPTGAWAGKANSIAEWSDVVGDWVYAAPKEGWSATINGTCLRYQYGGGVWGMGPQVGRVGRIQGLVLSNNAADANHDIDIAIGRASDTTNTVMLELSSSITKRLDAPWAAGTNQGGLDTGTKGVNGSYHLYLIQRAADGSIDALFSTSATNPVMPAGYSHRRRIGAVTTDGGGNIRAFRQIGGWFSYRGSAPPFSGLITTPALALYTVPGVPVGVKMLVEALIGSIGATDGFLVVRDPDCGAPAAADPSTAIRYRQSDAADSFSHQFWTDNAAQVYLGDSAALPKIYIYTRGWFDNRDED